MRADDVVGSRGAPTARRRRAGPPAEGHPTFWHRARSSAPSGTTVSSATGVSSASRIATTPPRPTPTPSTPPLRCWTGASSASASGSPRQPCTTSPRHVGGVFSPGFAVHGRAGEAPLQVSAVSRPSAECLVAGACSEGPARGFRYLRARTPSPASAPKPAHPGPGRPPGAKNRHRAPRYVEKTVTKDPQGRGLNKGPNSSPMLARKPASSPGQPFGTGGGSSGATTAPIDRKRLSAAFG
jgi:hypothetical protein